MDLNKINRLEEYVANYHKTKNGYDEILSLVAYTIYRFPLSDTRSSDDDCGDFYLYFMPSFQRILKHHKPGMRSFYGYLKQILRWRLNSFYQKKRREKIGNHIETHASMWDKMNHRQVEFNEWNESKIHKIFNSSEEKPIQKTVDKRVLLASSLKYSSKITEENWDRIIKVTASNHEWIQSKRQEVQEIIQAKMKYYFFWIKRRNKCYYKIRYYENLLKITNHPESIRKLKAKIMQLWDIYNRMIYKISAIRVNPSRLDIAKLLEIPKGTLDTSFSKLKHRLQKLDQAEEFKYSL